MSAADELPRAASAASHDTFSARDAMLAWMQEIAPYGIFTTDADLRLRSWNQWLATHSGLAAEKVIGRRLVEVFPDIAERKLEEHFRRALSGEISVLSTALHKYLLRLPSSTRSDDGSPMLQTVRIAPLPAGDVVVGTITLIEDVTQRERQALRLQRQQEHDRLLSATLAALLSSSRPLDDVAALFPRLTLPLSLEAYFNYVYHPDSATLHLNNAAGLPPRQRETLATLQLGEDISGRSAAERRPLILPRLQENTSDYTAIARGMGLRTVCCFPLVIEDRLLGTLAFASYTRDSLAPDEIECLSTVAQYVAIAMDRALREQALRDAQRSLSEHAESLEAKVAERTVRLHETIAQLESFSYSVAHDLRAPIRALAGYCDILRHDFVLPAGSPQIVDRLQRASYRLDALTRDLLKFSKISREEVKLEIVDVADLVQDILLLTPTLQDGVLVVKPPLGRVWAQRSLLQQCLSNLFENAVKFVPLGVRPHIILRAERRLGTTPPGAPAPRAFHSAVNRPDSASPIAGAPPATAQSTAPRLRLWIEDNGIGIAPEAHQKIFGIFERVGGHDHIEGTGIGLAIVARATQQMSGTCGVESTPGLGSRFWLEFPPAE